MTHTTPYKGRARPLFAGVTLAALMILGNAGLASAIVHNASSTSTPSGGTSGQSVNTTSTTSNTTTPGLPEAGLGGNASQNLMLMAVSGIALAAGAFWIGRAMRMNR